MARFWCCAAGVLLTGSTAATARAEQAPLPQLTVAHSLSLEVADVEATVSQVTEATREYGAVLTSRAGPRLMLRVSPGNLERMLRLLATLGHITRRSASTRDVTAEKADVEAALAGAERSRDRLSRMKTGDAKSDLLVERRIAEVEAEIARHRATLAALEQQTSSVELDIVLVGLHPVEPVPQHRLPIGWLESLSIANLQAPPPPPDPARPPIRANIDLAMQLEGRWLVERPVPDAASAAVVLALRSRGALTDPVGFAYGTDIAIGGWHGFVWELGLMGGVGASIAHVSTLGLIGGLSWNLWTGDRVPSALMAPAELFATLELGEWARVLTFAQLGWSLTSTDRDDGAKLFEVSDELSLGGALLLPAALDQNRIRDGGLRLGFVYGERVGTTMYTIIVGFGWGVVEH